MLAKARPDTRAGRADPHLATNGTVEVTARLVEIPDGAIFKRDLYDYATILKYRVLKVHRGKVDGDTIYVGHYNPWKPRSEAADARVKKSAATLRQFQAGQMHHLALDVPIEDYFMGGIVNKYFGQTTNRFTGRFGRTLGSESMVFTTHIFVFYFLPVFLLVYFNLPRAWRNLWITVASYVFYGWWQPWFVCLMMFTTVMDFIWGKVITRPGATRAQRKAGRHRLRRHQPQLPGLLQVLHVLRGDAEPAPGGGRRRAVPGAARRAAHRHLLLHLPLADLHH